MPKSNHKRRRAFALLLSAACAVSASGQQSYKIDETENTRCDLSEVAQVTDATMPLFAALEEHADARVAVVVYAPRAGDAMSYARQVSLWLTEVRGVPARRLLEVYGGRAGKKRLELWLVPTGAVPPTAAPPVERDAVTLFDTYGYWDGESCDSGRERALAVFAETLRALPGWRGTVVVRTYARPRGAKGDEGDWKPPTLTRRQASRRAASDRLHLVRRLGLDPARVRAVAGAPGEWAHAELWLIPPASSAAAGAR